MEKKYTLVSLAEAWVDKKITEEEMKKEYLKIPKFVPEPWEYGDDEDPILQSDGSCNTFLEVQAHLVGDKMTFQQFIEWRNIVTKTI